MPRSRTIVLLLCALVALSALSGCQSEVIEGHIPQRTVIKGSGSFLAGAAKEDLTPIPGFPMAGHAIAGKVSRGFWTRLHARALYLEDPNGFPLTLVSCDLWSVPAGLGDRVAEILAQRPEVAHIGRENLVLAATHTHQSQGNFASAAAFNEFAQPLPGFDRDLFEFLAQRIATAIERAHSRKVAATIALAHTRMPRVFRNRSMAPFLSDVEHDDVLTENEDLPLCAPNADFPDPRACRAVDPQLTVVRLEAQTTPPRLLGAAVFLAVHPTVMTHDLEAYSADLFGSAATLVERSLPPAADGEGGPVIALFNGPEGDITTTWEQQDRRNLLRLANQLSAAIADQLTGGVSLSTSMSGRFGVVPIAESCFQEKDGQRRCTPANAVPGAAAFGGAEDGRTVLEDIGYREGRRGTKRESQGAKLPAFDLDFGGLRFQLTDFVAGSNQVPKEAPIGIYRVGDLLLATLPGEFTTIMGRRIRALLREADPAAAEVLLIGLANEYLDYFTTPEEYDLQHYEGGSTMYGQASATLVGYRLREMAGELGTSPAPARRFRYRAGNRRHFTLADVGSPLYRPDDGLTSVLQDLDDGDPRRDFPCVCWDDGGRRMAEALGGKPTTPRVAIEDAESGTPISVGQNEEDDSGLDFVTVVAAADQRASRWCSFWMPPAEVAAERQVRFRVTDLSEQEHRSTSFAAGARMRDGCLALH